MSAVTPVEARLPPAVEAVAMTHLAAKQSVYSREDHREVRVVPTGLGNSAREQWASCVAFAVTDHAFCVALSTTDHAFCVALSTTDHASCVAPLTTDHTATTPSALRDVKT
ncbi:hypothetical protein ACFY5C_04250 [Streptomyces sp. NPDC012935]|uniref:hypothetical protein n=1 Tax=Streptomyces sp. NPDC012935 TaxID=3364857 RepID=UPI00368C4AD1